MSNVNTDFDTWFEANEPEDQQDLDDLVQSVETATTVGNYATVQKGVQLFVSRGTGSPLRLASDKAKAQFLLYVRDSNVPDDIDLDFQRAMEDPKS
jgi:hypothetical protein